MLVRLNAVICFLNKLKASRSKTNLCRSLVASIFVLCSSLSFATTALSPLQELNQLYQAFLDDHLEPGIKAGIPANLINYSAVKNDERIDTLIELLNQYPKEKLVSNEQKIAFYLNAYNILAIHKVAQNWPLVRLKSLGTYLKPVWTHPVPDVCGEKMTLRKLEHEILRKLGDPRIHFALNCASMSCPDLRAEPYIASQLEEQLEDQTRTFLSQVGKGYEIVGDNEVKLSPLFDWFRDDFEPVGGAMNYARQYLPESESPWEITGYLHYNWDVNCHLTTSEKRRLSTKRR